MSNLARIGHVYFSGNSYAPTRDVLLAVDVDACDVPAGELRGWSFAYSGSQPPKTFVRVAAARDDVRKAGHVRHIPTEVWNGTAHESHDALIAHHVARQAPVHGLPGARLPGER